MTGHLSLREGTTTGFLVARAAIGAFAAAGDLLAPTGGSSDARPATSTRSPDAGLQKLGDMQQTALRARMLAGDVLLGAWCMIGDMLPAEILGHAGYDWLVVDMEHGPITLATAQAMVMAIRTTPATAIVRVPWMGSASVQPVLDSGPYGIVVPMVNAASDARAVVRDARFLPLGERSRGGVRTALAFGTDPVTYFAQGNDQTIVMVQIETAEAVGNAAAIAAVEGIDCLFVGPSDLASTYGQTYPQAWESLSGPYGEAIRSIPRIARLHGKAAGILANSAAMGRECVAMGYTVVGISVDTSLLAAAARRDCAEFRQTEHRSASGGQPPPIE